MIRVIVASDESGEHEEVIFTESMETDAAAFFPHNLVVNSDTQILPLPDGFPLEYNLRRL